LIGAVIWFVIRRATQLEIGLVAILVGFLVGKAVRSGSGNRGGRGYQVLAVLITYCCIAANYMPDIIEAIFTQAKASHAADAAAAEPKGDAVVKKSEPKPGKEGPADEAKPEINAG